MTTDEGATRSRLAAAELRVRLGALVRGIRAATARRDALLSALVRPELGPYAVTHQHAQLMLAEAEAYAAKGRSYGPGTTLTAEERQRIDLLTAAATSAGFRVPSAVLADQGLSTLDIQLLLLVAAPGFDLSFGALFGYLNDLRSCTACTPYVAVEVLAVDAESEQAIVTASGPYGTLRSDGWVHASAVERSTATALRPADGVYEVLSGAAVDGGLLGRRPDRQPATSPLCSPAAVTRLAAALEAGRLDVVGVWGPERSSGQAVVAALAGRREVVPACAADLDLALQRAALRSAVCVVDVPADAEQAAWMAERVANASAPVILLGPEPLRWPSLMRRRRYAELAVSSSGYADRRATWSAAFPGLDPVGVADLAARFRLQPDEIAAVAHLDAASAGWATNGDRPALATLAGLVSRRRSAQVAATRTPSRGRDLLVLPAPELAQVMEIAEAARAWPRVAEAWRLDRFGNPGVTALFAGEPGTGKTLAAEVIASEVGLDLMEVDLSRLVSKWLGETEKHLDAVFAEAEASNGVLFFDEADSVFGQRGGVSSGTDRYANLEVGYLLQRLERFEGLVILASNLRANLDPAFTRRFHHVVHFPRPGVAERKRMWEIALGPPVRLAEPVDLDALAGLELTGAGIAAIVRSASLAAARGPRAGGPDALSVADVLQATRKQFQREARLLPREQLGAYAGLL